METMKAFVLPGPDASAGVQQIPIPEVRPGEVRIRVQGSSVNAWDAFVASGMARNMMEHRYPVVVGQDYAGVVDAVGEGVERFAIGDEVTGIVPSGPHLEVGSYAEYLVVPAEGFIEPKPEKLDFQQAASVGLAALTALVAAEATDISRGDHVLVAGATGGVGSYTVQLASNRGATVIATGLPDDESWLRRLGASEIVDYSRDPVGLVREGHPEGVDVLIDAVNRGDDHHRLAELVKDGGRVATATGAADEEALGKRRIRGANVFAQADSALFTRLVEMAQRDELTVPITRTFTFDEIPDALGLTGKRSRRGKFAIRIGG
jgi:NADPH:quinone reductase-like Zn-dependent oxidoreductase